MTLTMKAYSPIANKVLAALSCMTHKKDATGKQVLHDKKIALAASFKTISWSKSLIKQLLAFAAMADSEGEIAYIILDDLTAHIGCSVRTIKHNNKLLKDSGILDWETVYSGCISIAFTNYLDDIMDLQPAKDGAVSGLEVGLGEDTKYTSQNGYTMLSREAVEELLSIKDINVLRMSLRFLIHVEKDLYYQKLQATFISYEELKAVVPNYVRYKAAIKGICSQVSKKFRLTLLNTKEQMDSLVQSKKPSKAFKKKLKDSFLYKLKVANHDISKNQKAADDNAIFSKWAALQFELRTSTSVTKQALKVDQMSLASMVTTFGAPVLSAAIDRIKDSVQAFDAILTGGSNYIYPEQEALLQNEEMLRQFVDRFNANSVLCLRETAIQIV